MDQSPSVMAFMCIATRLSKPGKVAVFSLELTHIQPRCQFSAYKGSIRIGCGVQIAPYCSFYPYDHGTDPGDLISKQLVRSKGDIVTDDDAWLGVGVCVLDGARIGKGAVIGANSVVTSDIPDYSIAVGVPARVVKSRAELISKPALEEQNVG